MAPRGPSRPEKRSLRRQAAYTARASGQPPLAQAAAAFDTFRGVVAEAHRDGRGDDADTACRRVKDTLMDSSAALEKRASTKRRAK